MCWLSFDILEILKTAYSMRGVRVGSEGAGGEMERKTAGVTDFLMLWRGKWDVQ